MSSKQKSLIMDMHLQAMTPWWPGHFVLPDFVDEWMSSEQEVMAVLAVFVVDRAMQKMVYGRAG